MTDKETLTDMFNRNNIKFEESVDRLSFFIEAGYIGYVSAFSFSKEGNLEKVEAYEE